MSDNWQLDTRNALWAALGADAAWKRAFGGGTEHRFAKGQTLKRMEIEPAWCPIIAIGPGATELPPVSRRTLADDVDRYNLAV
ncbi:MAG: hypothetical protein FJ313_05000, partial [Gemmatimonadetes bacterium]|nr:hypothetical protein [Gemmatimonadota bacterium]